MSKGFVIDRGLSPIDGKPYVAILTVNSSNRKTGNMCQVFILCEDVDPVTAVSSGEDYSICGNCPHRKDSRSNTRSCYVNVGQAPLSVWRSYKRGNYKLLWTYEELEQTLSGRKIRWGAYGDPAILNSKIVHLLNGYASGHTGYTHQWRSEFATEFKGIFQASCDGFNDYLLATELGWKTFTVVSKNTAPQYAKQCPATITNSQAQCVTCSLCDGAKLDVFVNAHGSGAKYVTAA